MASRAPLESTISDFSKSLDGWNVTFAFDDGKRLHFNRGELASFSPVFDRMLLGDWKEGYSEDEDLPLPHKSFDDFHTILRMIAQYDESLITDANVAELLSLADEYEMRNILIYCSSYLLKHWQIGAKHFEALELALQFDLRKLTATLLPALVGSSLADLKVAAEALSPKVYAVVMHLRVVRHSDLSKIAFVLRCYPKCVALAYRFRCYWCQRPRQDCATGRCVGSAAKHPSTCRWCCSGDGVDNTCGICRRRRGRVEDEICICGVNCDDWLADEVVKMLLQKN